MGFITAIASTTYGGPVLGGILAGLTVGVALIGIMASHIANGFQKETDQVDMTPTFYKTHYGEKSQGLNYFTTTNTDAQGKQIRDGVSSDLLSSAEIGLGAGAAFGIAAAILTVLGSPEKAASLASAGAAASVAALVTGAVGAEWLNNRVNDYVNQQENV